MANPTGKGGFQRGVSGNPNGRPHMLTAIAPMARKHSAAAIKTLVEVAEKGVPDSARVSAAVALLDRGFGRPAQSIEMDLQLSKSFAAMSLEELQEVRQRLASLALASSALVIEHAEQPSPAEELSATSDNCTDDGESEQ